MNQSIEWNGRCDGALISLEAPDSWPNDLRSYLDNHHDLFLDWESRASEISSVEYDRAIGGLESLINRYALIGWHCTRLTEEEIAFINSEGMQLPDAVMLHRRIDAVTKAGHLPKSISDRLKVEHQADEQNRSGKFGYAFLNLALPEKVILNGFFGIGVGKLSIILMKMTPSLESCSAP